MEVEEDELKAVLEHGDAAAGRSRVTRCCLGLEAAGKEQLWWCGARDGRMRRGLTTGQHGRAGDDEDRVRRRWSPASGRVARQASSESEEKQEAGFSDLSDGGGWWCSRGSGGRGLAARKRARGGRDHGDREELSEGVGTKGASRGGEMTVLGREMGIKQEALPSL